METRFDAFRRAEGMPISNPRPPRGPRIIRLVCRGCRKRLDQVASAATIPSDPAWPEAVFRDGIPVGRNRIRDGVWRCKRCGNVWPVTERNLLGVVVAAQTSGRTAVELPFTIAEAEEGLAHLEALGLHPRDI